MLNCIIHAKCFEDSAKVSSFSINLEKEAGTADTFSNMQPNAFVLK